MTKATNIRSWEGARFQMAALFSAAVITNIAYTILIPFVPRIETRFGMDVMAIGAVFAGFALSKAVFQPVGGILVTRFEARHVACGGLLVGAAATLALGFAESGWQVIALRVLWGMGEGVAIPALFRLCFTIRPDVPEQQGRIVGWFGSAEVAGMAAGPALVGVFENMLGFRGIFILAAGITVVGATILAVCMGSSRTTLPPHEESPRGSRPSYFGLAVVLVLVFGSIDLLNNFLYAALELALPLYFVETFSGIDEIQFLSLLFFLGLLIFSVASFWTGILLEKTGAMRLTALAFAMATIGFVVQGVARDHLVLAAGFLLFMGSQPLIYVASRAVMGSLPSAEQGRAFGYFGLVSEFGWVLGPLAGAALVRPFGSGMFLAFAVLSGAAAVATLALHHCWEAKKTARPNGDDDRSCQGGGAT